MGHILARLTECRKQVTAALAVIGPVVLALLICAHLVASLRIKDSLNHVRDFRVGTTWIRDNAEADALIIAKEPHAIYLYAHRSTVDLPTSVADLQTIVSQWDHPYVLIAPKQDRSDAGEWSYDNSTQVLFEALQSGVVPAQIVFEDGSAMVRLYQVDATSHAAHPQ